MLGFVFASFQPAGHLCCFYNEKCTVFDTKYVLDSFTDAEGRGVPQLPKRKTLHFIAMHNGIFPTLGVHNTMETQREQVSSCVAIGTLERWKEKNLGVSDAWRVRSEGADTPPPTGRSDRSPCAVTVLSSGPLQRVSNVCRHTSQDGVALWAAPSPRPLHEPFLARRTPDGLLPSKWPRQWWCALNLNNMTGNYLARTFDLAATTSVQFYCAQCFQSPPRTTWVQQPQGPTPSDPVGNRS